MKSKILYFLGLFVLAFLISLPLILPYFKQGFFPTHDGEWAVVRLSDMYREIKDLQFPARFSGYLNFQYGYPLFNFAYPLPYYFGLIFVFLKMGFVGSIKILFSLSVIFSFLSMYLLSSSLWKSKWAGLISGIFYLYVPYRIVDLYVRGSIGESLSFVLFPLILWGIKKIYESKDLKYFFATSAFFALLVATHNIMTVLFGLIIFLIVVVSLLYKKFNFVFRLFGSLVFSMCLSAFFWIPAIFEKNLILLSKIPIADRNLYFVKPLDLVIPKWGYGTPTDPNGFGYQLGIPQLLALGFVILFFILKFKKESLRKLLSFLIISTLVISFLMFSASSILWHLPLLSEINYPWTVLSILIFLVALIAGYLGKLGKKYVSLGFILGLFAIIFVVSHAVPNYQVDRGDGFYVTNQATTTSSNELMPLWVKVFPLSAPSSKVVAKGNISNLKSKSNSISFNISSERNETVTINTIYYPGWEFKVDGTGTKINYNNKYGVMEINVPKGDHLVQGKLSETPLRMTADFISFAAIFTLIFYAIYSYFKKTK